MIYGDVWWYIMLYGDVWWYVIWWYMVIYGDMQWYDDRYIDHRASNCGAADLISQNGIH